MDRFYDSKNSIGFWVLGDDYRITPVSIKKRGLDIQVSNIEMIRQNIWRMVQSKDSNKRLLRINAIFFPCYEYNTIGVDYNGFIHAFSVVTQENGGTLVAVTNKDKCGVRGRLSIG